MNIAVNRCIGQDRKGHLREHLFVSRPLNTGDNHNLRRPELVILTVPLWHPAIQAVGHFLDRLHVTAGAGVEMPVGNAVETARRVLAQ